MNIKDYVLKYDPENQFDVMVKYYEQVQNTWTKELNISD